ncbi:MAG: restriction endonuclease subunit S [Acholeplasmataceae bacterium]|nr:restriction endonuclease subunit S [Acholeplasmataceae bacterium]
MTKIENLDIFIGDGNYAGKYPKANELLDHGVPFISAKDFNGRLFSDVDMRYISKELHSKLLKGHTKHNDILIVVRGNGVGKVSLVPKKYSDCNLNAQLALLRPNSDYINPIYLYYLLSSDEYYKMFNDYSSGSAQPQLTISAIKKAPVKIVPKKIQDEIANILSSLDDKIELNNKINENLEELAQTLYKRWFVDFEFPNEDREPYQSSGGEMVESELGLIPKGWLIREQGDYFPVLTGKKNANIATKNGKYKFFTCSQEIYQTDDYSFNGDAILVAGNGDFNVKYYSGKFEAYQRTYVLIPNNKKLSGVLFFAIKHNLDDITSGSRGSVISFITKGHIENFKVVLPNEKTLENMSDIFKDILISIAHNNEQNEKLSRLRDELLPKLMNGEIEVPIEE